MNRFGLKFGAIGCVLLIPNAIYAQQVADPAAQPTTAAPALPAAEAATPSVPGAIDTAPAVPAATGQLDQRASGTWSPAEQTFPGSAAQPSPTDNRPNGADRNQRGELGVWLVENGGPGVEVRRVTQGSAADQAGLQSGDVILELNGQGTSSPHEVARMIRNMPAGEMATIQFWRNGEVNELQIALQPARQPYEAAYRGDASLTEMNDSARREGDLEARTLRLEQQLAMVMDELRQLRQEIAIHSSSATGIESSAVDQPAVGANVPTGTEQEAAPAASPAGQGDTLENSPAAPPTGTATEPASSTETAPAAEASESDDLFE